jgi:hypothetical protein
MASAMADAALTVASVLFSAAASRPAATPSQRAASASQSSGVSMLSRQNGYVRHWVGRASYTLHLRRPRSAGGRGVSAEAGETPWKSGWSRHSKTDPRRKQDWILKRLQVGDYILSRPVGWRRSAALHPRGSARLVSARRGRTRVQGVNGRGREGGCCTHRLPSRNTHAVPAAFRRSAGRPCTTRKYLCRSVRRPHASVGGLDQFGLACGIALVWYRASWASLPCYKPCCRGAYVA